MLAIETEIFKGIMFVRVIGELSSRTIKQWDEEVKDLIVDNGITNVVFNLQKLRHFDDAGLKALFSCYLACINNHGQVYFCNVSLKLKEQMKNYFTYDNIEIKTENDAISIMGT